MSISDKIGVSIVVLLMVGMFAFMCYATYGALFIRKSIELELVAMSDGNNVTASFFLFGGDIDSEPVYKYLYKEGEYIRQDYHNATSSRIIESHATPIVTIEWRGIHGRRKWNKATFVIPPNSVVRMFEVDLK